MKVLIIGSGGREHALVKSCLASPLVESVIAAPGNGGIAVETVCKPLDVNSVTAIVSLAQTENIDFVIVGPEVPLALGVVDALEKVNITAYGPNKAAAQLEASKAFTKEFLARHSIPTAEYAVFVDCQSALEFLEDQTTFPIVIKASGLAAGKGVIIAQNQAQAERTVREIMEEGVFGDSGQAIVIEEYLEGEEASIHAIVCGEQFVLLPASQDHKRIGEGDTGPNTGGMGAYAPATVVTPTVQGAIIKKIIEPTLKGLKKEGIVYRGTLYIGIMITDAGPKVIEFNVRFGDPETQVLLPLIETDPVELLYTCAKGTLVPTTVKVRSEYAMVVVQAAKGYPATYPKGEVITLPTAIPPKGMIFHAGTKQNESSEIVTNGGRVLGVTALGDTLRAAADSAYALCKQIRFNSCYYRYDIGHRQLNRTDLVHSHEER